MVKLYGFCLSIAYIACPRHSYIENQVYWLSAKRHILLFVAHSTMPLSLVSTQQVPLIFCSTCSAKLLAVTAAVMIIDLECNFTKELCGHMHETNWIFKQMLRPTYASKLVCKSFVSYWHVAIWHIQCMFDGTDGSSSEHQSTNQSSISPLRFDTLVKCSLRYLFVILTALLMATVLL